MKKIHVPDNLKESTPKELSNLPEDARYSLTKISSKRAGWVNSGDTVTGDLEIVEVLDKPAVRVTRSFSDYIRTSPIVAIVDSTKGSVTFETEGGTYKLEKAN